MYSFWFKHDILTVDKIYQVVSNDKSLPPISRTNIFRFLKEINFRYSEQSQNIALTKKSKTVLLHRQFFEDLQKYREEGQYLYYVDETWVYVGECTNKTWMTEL